LKFCTCLLHSVRICSRIIRSLDCGLVFNWSILKNPEVDG
jgi:hypothetical protein